MSTDRRPHVRGKRSEDFALLTRDMTVPLRAKGSEGRENSLIPFQSRHADPRNVPGHRNLLVEAIAPDLIRSDEIAIGNYFERGGLVGSPYARVEGQTLGVHRLNGR